MTALIHTASVRLSSLLARFLEHRHSLWMILAGTLVLWSSAFVAIPIAIEGNSLQHVVLMRLLITSAILLPFFAKAWNRTYKPALKKDWKVILAMALSGVSLYMLALMAGQRTIGAGAASLMINLSPLITGFIAGLVLKEPFSKRLITGGVIALVGVFGLVISKDTGIGSNIGIDPNAFLVLASTVLQSIYFVIQRKLSSKYSAFQLTLLTIIPGTFVLIPLAGGITDSVATLTPGSALAILYLGVGPGLLPYIGWAYILSKLPAAKATVFLYFIPVLSSVMGVAILGEQLTGMFMLSGALIILGVLIGNNSIQRLRLTRRLKLKQTPAPCSDCPNP